MPEILTESFCERCGTRYTFESAAPRAARLKGLRVVSRGLKNFVMSDDTSMDEAMAAARSETDREATTQQLDAFHKTFNFCMSCRQYTCGNCWNETDGQCLSCAPHLGHEILPAPFPDLDPTAGGALLASGANGHGNGRNGHDEPSSLDPMAWPTSDLMHEDELVDPEVHAEDLEPIDAAARLTAIGAIDDPAPPPMVPVERSEEATAGPTEIDATDVDGRAAAAVQQTSSLLQRFRPGQDLDEAIAAFERDQAASMPGPEPAEAIEPTAAIEPAAAMEPAAAIEPAEAIVAIEPTSPVQLEPTAEPEPVREDVVAQPTWRIVAPDAPAAGGPPAPLPPTVPGPTAPEPVAASAEPQWPATPEWPNHRPTGGLPFLGRPATPTGGIEALWAESAREVTSATPASPAVRSNGGVQPCVSCGLSLSANARFCRRCGSRQA